MARATTQVDVSTEPRFDDLDLHFQELLDHIAVELAEEYVRLMEVAANADTDDRQVEEEQV